MVIYRVFDEVFRSWSHVAVLRALVDTTNGCTGNEAARSAGMHPLTALKALTALEQLGIVRRQRGGRDHLFTLNRDHVLVREVILPLYHTERQFPEILTVTLSAILRKPVVSAVIFGSVAKRVEIPLSDLDLCIIVSSEKQKERVRETVNAEAQQLYKKFGIRIAPLFFTVEEFRAKSKSRLVNDIIAHGRLIAGKNPKDLLRG